MFLSLLADESTAPSGNNIIMYVLIAVIVVALVAWLFLSSRKNKARQKEYVEQLDAIAPGHKVKTAGGICGIVVEVCDDNTVIIETGSEKSGKSYIKLDKELIAQTDAKGPTQIAREEAEARRRAEKAEKAAQKSEPVQVAEAPEENAAEVQEVPAETPVEAVETVEPAETAEESETK